MVDKQNDASPIIHEDTQIELKRVSLKRSWLELKTKSAERALGLIVQGDPAPVVPASTPLAADQQVVGTITKEFTTDRFGPVAVAGGTLEGKQIREIDRSKSLREDWKSLDDVEERGLKTQLIFKDETGTLKMTVNVNEPGPYPMGTEPKTLEAASTVDRNTYPGYDNSLPISAVVQNTAHTAYGLTSADQADYRGMLQSIENDVTNAVTKQPGAAAPVMTSAKAQAIVDTMKQMSAHIDADAVKGSAKRKEWNDAMSETDALCKKHGMELDSDECNNIRSGLAPRYDADGKKYSSEPRRSNFNGKS